MIHHLGNETYYRQLNLMWAKILSDILNLQFHKIQKKPLFKRNESYL